MLNKNEFIIVALSALIMAAGLSLLHFFENFWWVLLAVSLTILINIVAKKVTAYYMDTHIEIKPWEISRWGYKSHHRFSNPVSIGYFLPVITALFTAGYVTWMAPFIFDIKAKTYRASKRFGYYSFSEISEIHVGLVATIGIMTNLFFAIIGYLINFPEFSRINIYFAFFNLFPLSNLDGNKIFFASRVWWYVLSTLTIIGLFFALFLI